MKVRIVLIEPEIPQNCGNIMRLAAATGVELLLVGRLGFSLSDKYLKRSAMDYIDHLNFKTIHSIEEYISLSNEMYFISTKGDKTYTDIKISERGNDIVFGSESSGLPKQFYELYADKLFKIPMSKEYRSLNLSSSVAIITYHLLSLDNFNSLL